MRAEARDVGLAGIAVLPDRMRKLRTEKVEELAASMKLKGHPAGLINPITVMPREGTGTGYYLIAGRHRLEAARKLRWPSIPCRVHEGIDADDALLAEIDENLLGPDLSPMEEAHHIDVRKEVYERKYPQTKKGGKREGAGRKKSNGQTVTLNNDVQPAPDRREPPTQPEEPAASTAETAGAEGETKTAETKQDAFIDDTAKKTGRSRRTVARAARRGEKLRSKVKDLIGTSLDKKDELDALIELRGLDEAAAEALIERARNGEDVSAKTELKKIERAQKEATLALKQIALPDKRYGVILADPEWRFEPYSRDTGMDRAADNHYPTSSTDTIGSRDVESIAADDCVLFLWATVPMLLDAINVMEMWGFKYKSHAVWVKDRQGTGYWFRNKHELLLVGTRGNIPAPAPGTQWESVIEAPAGRHSEKPQDAYDMIEAYFPNLPKIELNARSRRAGWEAWGNEAEVVAA